MIIVLIHKIRKSFNVLCMNCNSYACAYATSVILRKGKDFINDRDKKRYKVIWTKGK